MGAHDVHSYEVKKYNNKNFCRAYLSFVFSGGILYLDTIGENACVNKIHKKRMASFPHFGKIKSGSILMHNNKYRKETNRQEMNLLKCSPPLLERARNKTKIAIQYSVNFP